MNSKNKRLFIISGLLLAIYLLSVGTYWIPTASNIFYPSKNIVSILDLQKPLGNPSLEPYDKLLEVDGKKVESSQEVIDIFLENKGSEVSIIADRIGNNFTSKLEIPATFPDEKLGITFGEGRQPNSVRDIPLPDSMARVRTLSEVVQFIILGYLSLTTFLLFKQKQIGVYLLGGLFAIWFLLIIL